MEMVATLICLGLLPPEILAFLAPDSATFLPYAIRFTPTDFPTETQTTFYGEDGQIAATVFIMLNEDKHTTWYSVTKYDKDGWEDFYNPYGKWERRYHAR